jgi:hypothetical protein
MVRLVRRTVVDEGVIAMIVVLAETGRGTHSILKEKFND